MASDFAQTLKQQADIVRVVGDYVSLKKAGAQNYSGLCPFHKEKTPSFSVHSARQYFYCFGCGEKGDVFSFVQKIENISFPEAVRAVAQKMGVALPKASFSSEAEAQDAKLRTALLEVHERACAFFQECLLGGEGARAREYLAGRGLMWAAVVERRRRVIVGLRSSVIGKVNVPILRKPRRVGHLPGDRERANDQRPATDGGLLHVFQIPQPGDVSDYE
ncbi:MAG: hypothetical protein DMG93_05390 [Acidobacteria bacterium]|nr:MAG: hypothetical protein DMG93_05390 [Acidobacteriota bacterium]